MNSKERNEHYRKAFNVKGELGEQVGISTVSTDKSEIFFKKFVEEIKRLLLKKEIIENDNIRLEDLHKLVSHDLLEYHKIEGVSPIGTMLYETDDQFIALYHQFLKWVFNEIFQFDFYFQETPTIRVQAPDSLAVIDKSNPPYPTYHTDLEYGHPPQEINIWWSFTMNTHTGFSIASLEKSKEWYQKFNFDLQDFKKSSLERGKAFTSYGDSICKEVLGGHLIFFDSRCIHSTLPRLDDTTRISIDARINPVKNFEWVELDGLPLYKGVGRRKVEFRPGAPGGYHKFSIKNLKLR